MKIIYNFNKFMDTKKGMTTNFFHPSLLFLRYYPFPSKLASHYCCGSAWIWCRFGSGSDFRLWCWSRFGPCLKFSTCWKIWTKNVTFILTRASLLYIDFFSRKRHRCQNYLFWTVYWNVEERRLYLYFWLKSVLQIRDILVRIRILGSVPYLW